MSLFAFSVFLSSIATLKIVDTAPCDSVTCSNSGNCQNVLSDTHYYCSCAGKYEGRTCIELTVLNRYKACHWSEHGESDAQGCTTLGNNSPDNCFKYIVNNLGYEPQVFGLFNKNRCCWGTYSNLKSDGKNYDSKGYCKYNCPGQSSKRCGGEQSFIGIGIWDYWNVYEIYRDSNQCSASPCEHGGQCVNKVGAFECLCAPGWQGQKCQTEINECWSTPCQHPSFTTCNDQVNGYSCACGPGFQGTHCEIDVDECLSNPCTGNSRCVDGENRWDCVCIDGWTGSACDIDVDECSLGQCKNDAQCLNSEGSYTCTCTSGWEGKDCDQDVDECASSPCLNGATCTNLADKYTCSCAPGWAGDTCNQNIDECASNPCQYKSPCIDKVNKYECDCVSGTQGTHCEIDINECVSSPCNSKDNQAVCVDHLNGFTCTCTAQWTNTLCDMDIESYKKASKVSDEIDLDGMSDPLSKSGTTADASPFIIAHLNESLQRNLSWSYEDIFSWCLFAGESCDGPNDIVQWFESTMGNCFTFNHDQVHLNYSYRVNRAGMGQGLELFLQAGQTDYLPWIDTAGLRIFIHNQSDAITSESFGLHLIPGYYTNIAIEWIEFIRLQSPYGKCVKNKDQMAYYYYYGSYSTEGCIRSCYQNQLFADIGCQDPRYPSDPNRKICELNKSKNLQISNKNIKIEGSEIDNFTKTKGDKRDWNCAAVDDCPLPCYSGMYRTTQTRSIFPDMPPSCDIEKTDDERRNCSDRVHHQQVHVQIYFEKAGYVVMEEVPRYPKEKVMADLGGQLGILAGISVISIAEIIFLIISATFTFMTNVY